jgi:hypothetical protein
MTGMRPTFAITAAVILAFVGGLALAASTQAAPLAPTPITLEPCAGPPIELVAEGCGWGWHRRQWQDRWGNWHWGRCVPDGGPYGGWGAGWSYHPHPYWRGASPDWGWGNP